MWHDCINITQTQNILIQNKTTFTGRKRRPTCGWDGSVLLIIINTSCSFSSQLMTCFNFTSRSCSVILLLMINCFGLVSDFDPDWPFLELAVFFWLTSLNVVALTSTNSWSFPFARSIASDFFICPIELPSLSSRMIREEEENFSFFVCSSPLFPSSDDSLVVTREQTWKAATPFTGWYRVLKLEWCTAYVTCLMKFRVETKSWCRLWSLENVCRCILRHITAWSCARSLNLENKQS